MKQITADSAPFGVDRKLALTAPEDRRPLFAPSRGGAERDRLVPGLSPAALTLAKAGKNRFDEAKTPSTKSADAARVRRNGSCGRSLCASRRRFGDPGMNVRISPYMRSCHLSRGRLKSYRQASMTAVCAARLPRFRSDSAETAGAATFVGSCDPLPWRPYTCRAR